MFSTLKQPLKVPLARLFSTPKKSRPIFIAATRQHTGKTTTSLALVSGLQKRFGKVGFIKPVGQQHVSVYSETDAVEIRVDKDVKLIKEHFRLDHIDYSTMSPVIIPRGKRESAKREAYARSICPKKYNTRATFAHVINPSYYRVHARLHRRAY